MLPLLTHLLLTVYIFSNRTTDPVSTPNLVSKTVVQDPLPVLNFDFSYTVDPCDPLTVRFTSIGPVTASPYWDLGDGTIIMDQLQITHTYAVPGNYHVRHSVTTPIPDTLNKDISINFSIENVVLTNDTTICYGDSKKLLSVPALKYCWSPATGLDNPQAAEPVFTATQDITYFLNAQIVINNKIFIKRDSVKITVDKPVVKTRKDTTICPKEPVQLFATGAATYSWTPSEYLSSTSINNPIATTADPMQYIVTGTNVKGCKASDTVNISIYPYPYLWITPTQTICKNTKAELMASGGVAYDWFPEETLNNPHAGFLRASPKVNTMYYVDITDNNSCIYRDSVQVNIRPDPVFAVKGGGDICLNDTMQLQASGGDIYSWQPESGLNNPASSNPLASPTTTTDYMVTVLETACNQSTVLPVRVKVLPLPGIRAARNVDLDCFNDRSQLSARGGGVYSWKPIATLTNPGIANPVARPLVTTTYVVKGTDGWGCSNYDSIVVKVELANKGGYLMPNAFTPNNDGHNDCYGVKYWGIIDKIEFSIFDRWGHRVFFTKDPNQCWDGKANGKDLEPGVYVYVVKASTVCQPEVFKKGTFALIR